MEIHAKDIKKSGVYKLTCKNTGKFYIGSSVNLYHRLKSHRYSLIKKIHTNSYLQNSVNKYGIDSIKISILEYCSKDKLLKREEYYIKTTKPAFNFILKPVTKSDYTPELRNKLSLLHKKRYTDGLTKSPAVRSVDCYTLDGDFVKSFSSMNEAAIQLKLPVGKNGWPSTSHITSCCKYRRNAAYGYQWRYAKDTKPNALTLIQKKNCSSAVTIVTDLTTGEEVEFNNFTKLKQFFNQQSMSNKEYKVSFKYNNI